MDIPLFMVISGGTGSLLIMQIVACIRKSLVPFLLIHDDTEKKDNRKWQGNLIVKLAENRLRALSAAVTEGDTSNVRKLQDFEEENDCSVYFGGYGKLTTENRKKIMEIITAGFGNVSKENNGNLIHFTGDQKKEGIHVQRDKRIGTSARNWRFIKQFTAVLKRSVPAAGVIRMMQSMDFPVPAITKDTTMVHDNNFDSFLFLNKNFILNYQANIS